MRSAEGRGKSVNEAIEVALRQLGASRDAVEIKILEEPSKGFLGLIGNRAARVQAQLADNTAAETESLLQEILQQMGFSVTMQTESSAETVNISLEGNNLGLLIGRRGETLNALQYILSVAVNKKRTERKRIVIDVAGYRGKRESTLASLANKLADKALQRKRNVVLEPMNQQERRVIHTTLREREDVYTFSEGADPFRRVIIAPRK